MKKLDFIVIGAAKSGTTTLFELSKKHPEIFMPREKEIPFFSDEYLYKKGISWYLSTYFRYNDERKCGSMTPQYMLGEGANNPDKVAERIKQDFPDIKIVAILRHPVERAYSHYQMLSQRGHFKKGFSVTVEDLLNDSSLDDYRTGLNPIEDSNAFLLGSEYGRILSYYYKKFSREQILVLFTDDLKRDPSSVLENYFGFLGINTTYKPETLGKEFRKGGSKPKLKLLTPGFLFKIPFLEKVWKSYIPYVIRKRVEYSINLWNIKSGTTNLRKDDPVYEKLAAFYASDIEKLEKLIGDKTPWKDWTDRTK